MNLSDYAIIQNGIVKNVVVGTFTDCDRVAKEIYGNDAFVVEVWSHYFPASAQIPTMAGDTYNNGKFYRDGIEIEPVPTIEQELVELRTQTAVNTETIDRNEAQTYYTAVMTDTLIEEDE